MRCTFTWELANTLVIALFGIFFIVLFGILLANSFLPLYAEKPASKDTEKPVFYSELRCQANQKSNCKIPFWSEYSTLFERAESDKFLDLFLQGIVVGLIAVCLSSISVFCVEFLVGTWPRRVFYVGAVLTFFISAPVRALGYYGIFSSKLLTSSLWWVGIEHPDDVSTSYFSFFLALVFGVIPPAIFPLQIAFSKYANEHRPSIREFSNVPIILLFCGIVRNSKYALTIAFTLSTVFALSAYHESKQFEKIWSAQKLAKAFENSMYGELYAMATLFSLLSVAIVIGCFFLVAKLLRR